VKTVEDHLRKVFSTHQKDWDEANHLPAGIQSAGMTPTSMVFRRELHLLCNLLFMAPPNKEQSQLTTWQTLWIGCMTSIIMHTNI
jgi:hypothetical protein